MSAVKKSFVVDAVRKGQMTELLAQGKRLDGRAIDAHRDIKIEVGVIEKANGSAIVSMGNTQVIAGVKIAHGTPFADTPDKGLLIVGAEVLPLSSPYAEAGPPNEDAIELARVVDRGIRESEMVDLSKLCIEPKKAVYTIFVDVNVLNVDGNLFDTTSYAVVSALLNSKMPEYVMEDGAVKDTGKVMPVAVQTVPVSTTFARIGNTLILDPTSEEEAAMDARITLVTTDEGNLCAGQKGKPGTLSSEQVFQAAELSISKGREIREILRKAKA
jgi:exosome complex component RRP42